MIEDGVFWLPESPDSPIRGQLSFGVEQAPTVKLTDALTPALRIVSTRTNEDGSVVSEMEPVDDTENFVVHGLLRNSPRAVTLVDCLTTQRRSVVAAGPHFEDQTLRARYIVRGAHVSGDDQLYSGVKIRVRGIDEWARLPGFSISTGSTDEVTLKYARTEMPSARTAAGHLVRFSESMRRSWPGPTGGHIRREAWLMVEDFGEVEFSELSRRYISPLVSVLNLAMGQPAPLTATSVRIQGEGNSDWCNVWHNYISESEAIKNSDYMLPLDSFGVANTNAIVEAQNPMVSGLDDVVKATRFALAAFVSALLVTGIGIAFKNAPTAQALVYVLATLAFVLAWAAVNSGIRLREWDWLSDRARKPDLVAQDIRARSSSECGIHHCELSSQGRVWLLIYMTTGRPVDEWRVAFRVQTVAPWLRYYW